jgi:cephalosporin hydroxylase
MNSEALQKSIQFKTKAQVFSAWKGHENFLAWLLQELQPRVFVELGSHYGFSYFAACQAAEEFQLETKCFAVDTWQGDQHAGKYDDSVFQSVLSYNEAKYPKNSQLLRMTFDQALTKFQDLSVELLHIDGLHTYEAVKHDFESWLPKLAPGAVVLFHDTQVTDRDFGVWRYWKELMERYPRNMEFLHSHGLGVLQISSLENSNKCGWLASEIAQKQLLREFFYAHSLHTSALESLQNRHKQDYEKQRAIIDSVISQIHQIKQSNSWKLAAPLRALADVLRRFKS